MSTPGYPLSAIVGQEDLIEALLICAVHPIVGGVLVRGERGTAKSTAVRALAPVLGSEAAPAPLVELPLGATLDRVIGTLDLRAAMSGTHRVEPGLLGRANGGLLYVDEINLLADHLVDVLLDASAFGSVTVERDGVSAVQEARFVLVGTMNPEEGELRPQLLDRFGLSAQVSGPPTATARAEIVRRRLAYDEDPAGFVAEWASPEAALIERVHAARGRVSAVTLPERELLRITQVCASLGLDGVRGDLVCAQAARALAALDDAPAVTAAHVARAAQLALRHRMHRDPLAPPPGPGGDSAIDDAFDETREPTGEGAPKEAGRPGADGAPPPAPEPAPAEATAPTNPGQPDSGEAPAEAGSEGDARPDAPAWQPSPDLAPPPRPRPLTETPPPRPVAAIDARLPEDALRLPPGQGRRQRRRGITEPTPPGRARGGTLAVVDSRPADDGDPIAILPTLLASLRGTPGAQTAITGGGRGALLCLVVDTSGSMGAQRRLARVKGALEATLRGAYARRDAVAIIGFGGERAETIVEPGLPLEQAAAAVHALPAGGRTPLVAGLEHAATVLERSTRGQHAGRARITVLLTDGRAADPAGAAPAALRRLVERSDRTVVVDLEDGRVRLGLAATLATAAGADLTRLVTFTPGSDRHHHSTPTPRSTA